MKLTRIFTCLALAVATLAFGQHPHHQKPRPHDTPPGDWNTEGPDPTQQYLHANVDHWNLRPIDLLRRHAFPYPGGSGDRGVMQLEFPKSRAGEAYKLLVRDSKRHHTYLRIQNPEGKWETYFKLNDAAYEKWAHKLWEKVEASLIHIADIEQWNEEPLDRLQKRGFSLSVMSDLGISIVKVPKKQATSTVYKLLVQDCKRFHRWLHIRNPKGQWETYFKLNPEAYDKWVKNQVAGSGQVSR